jgi:cardiolipin synthase
MTEEVGDDPGLLPLMAANGSRWHRLVPPPTSAVTIARLAALAFLGSQNLSSVSLQDNREMGLIVTGSARAPLATWFDQWWARATPWS